MADTPHPSSIAGGPYDGVTFPYIPKATPIQIANPLIGDPQRFIDARVEFRQFYCPACGGLLENEVCRAGDPLLHDIELAG